MRSRVLVGTRSRERGIGLALPRSLGKELICPRLASRTVREHTAVVLSYSVCGHLSLQPQDANTGAGAVFQVICAPSQAGVSAVRTRVQKESGL